MDIRFLYDLAVDRLEVDVEGGLRDLVDVYCMAVDSFDSDIVDSVCLYVIDLGGEDVCRYLKKVLALKGGWFFGFGI